MALDILAPRLNSNEDQVLVVQVAVRPGDRVTEGALLFVLETTKASSEVLAPRAGVVEPPMAVAGAMVDVGAVLCRLQADGAAGADAAAKGQSAPGGIHITAKARLRARQEGIDIDAVPAVDGRVGVAEVEAFAAAARPRALAVAAADARAVIVGGGGHAAMIADLLVGTGYRLEGCTDPSVPVGTVVVPGLTVIGTDDILADLRADGVAVAFVGLGGAVDNRARRRLFTRLVELGFALPPVIHPRAHVGLATSLGAASYVLPGAVVGPRCGIGDNVVVNQGSQIAHDSVIGDHCHLTPGALIAGGCTIGAGTTVGMGASVLFGCRVGRDCLIHNSAAVTGDISDNTEYTADGRRLPRRRS